MAQKESKKDTNSNQKGIFKKSIIIGICASVALFILDIVIMAIRQKSDDFPYIKNILLLPLWESIMQFIGFQNFEFAKVIAIVSYIPYIILVGAFYGFIIGLIIYYLGLPKK